MKFLSLFLLAGAAISAAPITTSQVTLVNAGSLLVSDGSYYVGPYTLSVNGQNYAALCVDFLDQTAIGTSWTSTLSQVGGDISSTYRPADTVQYKEEAYLYSLIAQPGADRVDIQHAAWYITDPTYATDSASQAYVNLAMNNYASLNFSGFEIVSSVDGGDQEFIIDTPEPGSLMLLGMGLLITGLGLARRRKLVQA